MACPGILSPEDTELTLTPFPSGSVWRGSGLSEAGGLRKSSGTWGRAGPVHIEAPLPFGLKELRRFVARKELSARTLRSGRLLRPRDCLPWPLTAHQPPADQPGDAERDSAELGPLASQTRVPGSLENWARVLPTAHPTQCPFTEYLGVPRRC